MLQSDGKVVSRNRYTYMRNSRDKNGFENVVATFLKILKFPWLLQWENYVINWSV